MAEMVSVEQAKMGEWRDVPTGRLRTTYFLASPPGTDLPQCFRVENTPHRHLDSHFHTTDQFQVITAGTGTLGRHAVAPFAVHFARAHTPYGPLVAGADGMAWLSIRARHDDGAQYMPASRDALLAVKDRQPWQVTQSVAFDEVREDGTLHPLAGIHDARGLGAFAVRVPPGATLTLPDPSATGGQFLVAVRGGVRQAAGDTQSLATMLVRPDEAAVTVTAGAAGLDALVLHFPRDNAPAQEPAPAQADEAAARLWHCEPCGFVYDEATGLPAEGIAPGTRFEDLPAGWHCPDCDATRDDFVEFDF